MRWLWLAVTCRRHRWVRLTPRAWVRETYRLGRGWVR
jgi:hypothetical protein